MTKNNKNDHSAPEQFIRPIIVGVSGLSGSGKSSLASKLCNTLGEESASVLSCDSYYKDLRHLKPTERSNVNFDHPDALDSKLLIKHLKLLKEGRSVSCPQYDFYKHIRLQEREVLIPQNYVFVDGILLLAMSSIRKILDCSIFLDVPPDICIVRRLARDYKSRGRNIEDAVKQYLTHVRPMSIEYVIPSKQYASIVLSGCESEKYVVEKIQQFILTTQNDCSCS